MSQTVITLSLHPVLEAPAIGTVDPASLGSRIKDCTVPVHMRSVKLTQLAENTRHRRRAPRDHPGMAHRRCLCGSTNGESRTVLSDLYLLGANPGGRLSPTESVILRQPYILTHLPLRKSSPFTLITKLSSPPDVDDANPVSKREVAYEKHNLPSVSSPQPHPQGSIKNTAHGLHVIPFTDQGPSPSTLSHRELSNIYRSIDLRTGLLRVNLGTRLGKFSRWYVARGDRAVGWHGLKSDEVSRRQ